jgi:NAD(P)-dependent dehydrogenase (short-subunit alcohol dehydrogenase family)
MENKVAFCTGGLTGIGSRAAAIAFVRKGAKIILLR